jgi:predicted amidohydrolase YtcJ
MDATLSVYKTDGPHCHLELAGDITRAMHRRHQDHRRHRYRQHRRRSFPVVDGELEKLVKYAGFTPQEAIIAATANAASAGQAKEFGTLEAGKYANMVFLQRTRCRISATCAQSS